MKTKVFALLVCCRLGWPKTFLHAQLCQKSAALPMFTDTDITDKLRQVLTFIPTVLVLTNLIYSTDKLTNGTEKFREVLTSTEKVLTLLISL